METLVAPPSSAPTPPPAQGFIARLKDKLLRFSGRPWYGALVGAFAGLDSFLVVIPIDALLVGGVLLHPKKWKGMAFQIALGSSLGALVLAALAYYHGDWVMQKFLADQVHTRTWLRSVHFVQKYGAWAVAFISVGPIPQQPAVAFAGISHLPPLEIFAAVMAGRLTKYAFLGWIGSHAPDKLERIFGWKIR